MYCRRRVLELFEEQSALISERVSYGIEAYRKGNGRIRVVDKCGAPITNAKIRLSQKGHEFRFGANLFMLDELESDEKSFSSIGGQQGQVCQSQRWCPSPFSSGF